jgi:hypothetical protein
MLIPFEQSIVLADFWLSPMRYWIPLCREEVLVI